jgi:hypothetical protein
MSNHQVQSDRQGRLADGTVRHNPSAAPQSRNREKGLWNFLTWSFFISQVLAAQQLIGASAAHAADNAELGASGGERDDAPGRVAAAAPQNDRGGVDDAAADANTAAGALEQAQDLFEGNLASLAAEQVNHGAGTEDGNNAGTIVHAFSSGAGADHSAAPEGGGGVPLPPDTAEPGLVIPGLDDVLEGVIPPVLGAVVEIVGSVDDLLDGVLGGTLVPVIGVVDHVVDAVLEQTVAPLLGTVEHTLEAILDQAVAPLLTVADGILDATLDTLALPLLGTIDAVLDSAVAPVAGTLSELIGTIDAVADSLIAPLAHTVADVTGTLGAATDQVLSSLADTTGETLAAASAPVATIVGDTVSLLTGGDGGLPIVGQLLGDGFAISGSIAAATDAVASAGIIELSPVTNLGNLDQLFSGGLYTDYNLALQTAEPGASAGVTALASNGSGGLVGQILAGVEQIADDNEDASAAAPPVLPSVLADIGLRGWGDGLL